MSTYPGVEAYTADVTRAVRAYESDEAVRAGFCANLDGRMKDGRSRVCWTCRHTESGAAA